MTLRKIKHKTIAKALDPTQIWQVGQSSDDCTKRLEPVSFGLNWDNLPVGDESETYYDYQGGLRFANIAIPKNAIIISARLRLRALYYSGTLPTITIRGQNSDNAPTFFAGEWPYTDFDTRPRTVASVAWAPLEWVGDTWYDSPDIKAIIQEIVNRDGWSSGNAIAIFLQDAPGWEGIASGFSFASWDRNPALAPQLEISWTEEGVPPPQVTVAVAPADVTIEVGQTATLTATPSGGTPPYSYQWYDALTNSPISGATQATIDIVGTIEGDITVYCIVTDSLGDSAQSNNAVIHVTAPPPPPPILHTLTVDSTPIQGIPFTIEKVS